MNKKTIPPTREYRGIVRKIDDLGRISIPKEYRDSLRFETSQAVEIFMTTNDEIIIKPIKIVERINL